MKMNLFPLQNRGMSRDLSVSKAENTFAWENYNVRLTAREGDTLLSITNERGPKSLDITISGNVIGWNALGDNLILFTTATPPSTTDKIIRINLTENTPKSTVYSGYLGFDMDHPIESIVSYESEDVQKIYWVDGKNVLRSCNFMHSYGSTLTNIVQTLFDSDRGIKVPMSISVEKDNGGSSRPNGTVQYFVTAYDKLGVETGIVAMSSLVYLSPLDRGGSPDEYNSNRITLEVSYTGTLGFDYIRVYALLRTSYNGPEVCSIVGEYKASSPIKVVDTGANYLGNIDVTKLLYLGSKTVVASTVEEKDNTLFLGNLDVKSADYTALDSWAGGYRDSDGQCADIDPTAEEDVHTGISFDTEAIPYAAPVDTYPYNLQLNLPSNDIKIFKGGEKYRFAVVFSKANGDRSKAFWVGDKVIPEYPVVEDYTEDGKTKYKISYSVPQLTIDIPTAATEVGYEYAQLYMAQATYADRRIKAQGFLNPTVYNLYDRYNNQPYARPSWTARPMLGNAEFMHFRSLHNSNDKQGELQSNWWQANRPRSYYTKSGGIIDGYIPEAWQSRAEELSELDGYSYVGFIMDWTKSGKYYKGRIRIYRATSPGTGWPTGNESSDFLRQVFIADEATLIWSDFSRAVRKACDEDPILRLYYFPSSTQLEQFNTTAGAGPYINKLIDNSGAIDVSIQQVNLNSADLFCQYSRQHYFVDSNIVTMHSPEIEYEQVNLDRRTELELRVVGASFITGSVTDMSMRVADPDYLGNNVAKQDYSTSNPSTDYGTLTAAPVYYDSRTKDDEEGKTVPDMGQAYYYTYLLHKSGSIINYVTSEGKTVSSLVSKRFANMQFSYYTQYVSGISQNSYTIDDLSDIRQILGYSSGVYEFKTFNGTQKLYGVNTSSTVLMPTKFKYPVYCEPSFSSSYSGIGTNGIYYEATSSDPVSITYNSRPHLLLSLPFTVEDSSANITVLPRIDTTTDREDKFDLYEDPANNYVASSNTCSFRITDAVYDAITQGGLKIIGTEDFSSPTFAIVASGGGATSYSPTTSYDQDTYCLTVTDSYLSSGYKGNILHITFGPNYPDGIYLYDSSDAPVDAYGNSSSTLYLGWDDTVEINDSGVDQGEIALSTSSLFTTKAYLLIGELCETYDDYGDNDPRYGGITQSAIQNNTFIPCGEPVKLAGTTVTLKGTEGDTYFQRYDCVMAYPQSENDTNQILDIASVMLETHVNIDGRVDKDRRAHRLADIDYTNFGILNPVYQQENNYLQAREYDDKFNQGKYATTVTWSLTKHPLETNDTWMNVSLANTMTMDPQHGPLNAISKFKNTLLAFQDKAISEIMFNSRVQLQNSAGVPIELANSGKVDGSRIISNHYGCLNKWSIVEGKSGMYFKDDIAKVIGVLNDKGIDPLSSKAKLDAWVRASASTVPWTPSSWGNTVAFYDNEHSDVYFVNSERVPSGSTTVLNPYPCLVYNEQLGSFTGFFSYGSIPVMATLKDRFVCQYGTGLFEMNAGNYNEFLGSFSYQPSSVTWRVTPEPYGDKIWTNLEYRADFTTVLDASKKVIYNEVDPSLDDTTTYTSRLYQPNVTIDKIRIWNEYQDTGDFSVPSFSPDSVESYPDARKKFRVWRTDIPRDANSQYGLDRIRNPWIWLKVQKNFSNTSDKMRMELHDMVVKYFTND